MPRESHGQSNLVGYGPWGHRESDTTEVTKHIRFQPQLTIPLQIDSKTFIDLRDTGTPINRPIKSTKCIVRSISSEPGSEMLWARLRPPDTQADWRETGVRITALTHLHQVLSHMRCPRPWEPLRPGCQNHIVKPPRPTG